MNIEKLEIKGFGRINNLVLNLSKGLNIIFGNNESGKTSIQWFIRAMFFGLKGGRTSRDGVYPPLKRFNPWKCTDFGGSIEYRLDSGELFRVEREFSNNSIKIFDFHYNDIANTFDTNREKGLLFAEKHLGLNELCFDKTVFVKQMEARIDGDGGKALINRLINISETGFEDVSCRRAQEALKEALKNYVGTDKTSTRPMDKVTCRLEELEALKASLIQKRDSLFDVENQLKVLEVQKSVIEQQKHVWVKVKDIIELKKDIKQKKKQDEVLEDIIGDIAKKEEELELIKSKNAELISIREQLYGFSIYDREDAEDLALQYHRFVDLKHENKKLEGEIDKKKADSWKIECEIEPIRAFSTMEYNVDDIVVSLKNEVNKLKEEHQKSDIKIISETIKKMSRKEKISKYNMGALLVISILLGLVGYLNRNLIFIGVSSAIFTIAVIFFFMVKRTGTKIISLKNEKKVSFIYVNNIQEKINTNTKMLDDILQKVGVQSVEEFLRLKAVYDSKSNRLTELNSFIDDMEKEFTVNSCKLSETKEKISKKLLEAGILESIEFELKEEYVKSFRQGIGKNKEIEPEINYITQRKKELADDLKILYNKALILSGTQCCSQECITSIKSSLTDEINIQNRTLDMNISELKELLNNEGLQDGHFDINNLFNDWDSLESKWEDNYKKVCEDLSSIVLKIKELETIIKSLSCDGEDIQKIDEEIHELEVVRKNLEDVDYSLKTALEVLTEASTEIQRDFAPALNSEMSRIINVISGGKYFDLRADDNLNLKVIAPETQDVTSAMMLSGGTIDQIYLALRLATANLISGGKEKLPVIMDESFAHYDDDRTGEAFRFLHRMACDRQIIIFTCKRREVDIAREVCDDYLNVINI